MNEQAYKNQIKAEMKKQGLTYKSMGERVSMSERGVRSILNDHRAPFWRLLEFTSVLGWVFKLKPNLSAVEPSNKELIGIHISNLKDFQKFKMTKKDIEWKTWIGRNGKIGVFYSDNVKKYTGSGSVTIFDKEMKNKAVFIEKELQ